MPKPQQPPSDRRGSSIINTAITPNASSNHSRYTIPNIRLWCRRNHREIAWCVGHLSLPAQCTRFSDCMAARSAFASCLQRASQLKCACRYLGVRGDAIWQRNEKFWYFSPRVGRRDVLSGCQVRKYNR